MSEGAQFDYERFIRLSGLELCRYMDAILATPTTLTVSQDVIARLLHDMESFDDEYHIVYGLELLFFFAPDSVMQHVPKYLAHREGSVWCAASRILLSWARPEQLTPEVIAKVRQVAELHADNKYVQDTWKELISRIGTADAN